MAGHGFRIIPGVGLHFIMDAGITMIIMAGFGYPITNGAPRGSPGEAAMVTTAGRQCGQELALA
ncbi:MAG TPA: hypothetical protein DCR40_19525 [Prolixibacteraceae bacterium]|nr:hypothetical protein [Prolixibacteraceae bacterium]